MERTWRSLVVATVVAWGLAGWLFWIDFTNGFDLSATRSLGLTVALMLTILPIASGSVFATKRTLPTLSKVAYGLVLVSWPWIVMLAIWIVAVSIDLPGGPFGVD